MALSSAMQFTHSGFTKSNFSSFSNEVGTGTIWNNISSLSVDGNNDWNNYDDGPVPHIIGHTLKQN